VCENGGANMVTTPKVLVIDDSNTQCLFMRQALQSAGYQVLVANDGQEGLRIMKLESPQCLVLDIVLPGMSGFELCRYIRAQEAWHTLPIIMVSTKNSSSDRFWAMRQGATQYLPKPFKQEELIKTVMEVLLEAAPDGPSPLRSSSSTPGRANTAPQPAAGRTFSSTTADNIESIRPVSGMTGPRNAVNASNADPRQGVNFGNAGSRNTVNSGMTGPRNVVNASNPVNAAPISSANWHGQGQTTGNVLFPQPTTSINPSTHTPRNTAPGPGNSLPSRPHPQANNLPRSFVEASPTRTIHQQSLYALSKFIPRRIDAPELLWSNSPEVLAILDRRARQLYMAIDGQKNVEALTSITQMNREEIVYSLRFLLSQQRIQLYEPEGRLFDSSLFESLLI
jgi:CheY-like chemotaxis protein